MTDRELMQQALAALEYVNRMTGWSSRDAWEQWRNKVERPIAALRERLAQDKVECSRCGRTLADLPNPKQCPPCTGNCNQGRACPARNQA